MPIPKRCLGTCSPRALITSGSYCPECREGTGWGKGRDRGTAARLRAACLERDGYRCTYTVHIGEWSDRCPNTHNLECCHIVARAHGGPDTLDNVRTLCNTHHKQTDPKAR